MKYILRYSFIAILLLNSCNNELIQDEFQNTEEETILIPERITYTRPNLGFTRHMYYNELGLPVVFTDQDSTTIYGRFEYDDNDLLTQYYNFDGNHFNYYSFYYENSQLDSIHCYCHNGVGQTNWSLKIEYLNEKVNFINEQDQIGTSLTFMTADRKVLKEVESFFSEGSYVSSTLSKFYYDENLNPTQRAYYFFNDDTSMYELNFVENQLFDSKFNVHKYTQKLAIELELFIFPFGWNLSTLDILNRFGSNNLIYRERITEFNNFSNYEFNNQYLYNELEYPIYQEQPDNDGLREYYIDYYED